MGRLVAGIALALCVAGPARADLSVVEAGPTGALADLDQGLEIKVVFSEPVVALGRIPEPVTVPFFHLTPAVEGSLRWAGTRTLVFTPKDAAALPFATRFEVTLDASATAVAGSALGKPYRFSFTTPTVRILNADWVRKGGRYDAPALIALRFNQPVDPKAIAAHLALALAPHDFTPPALPERVDGLAPEEFDAKVARAQQTARSTTRLDFHLAKAWDKERWAPGADLVVLETDTAPPTDAWVKVVLDATVPGKQGKQTPGQAQDSTLQLEPTFFVLGFRCAEACDPDGWNPLRLSRSIAVKGAQAQVQASDVTDPQASKPLKRVLRARGESDYDTSDEPTLEDAGFTLAPAHTYEVLVGRDLTAEDGQTLGYTWVGRVENWHKNAFTSFGTGHGVWEKSGGATLPFYARNLLQVKSWLAPVKADELMPLMLRLGEKSFEQTPAGPGTPRKLQPKGDLTQTFGIDLAPVLSPGGTGLLWAALEDGAPVARSHGTATAPHSTLVQVTNLGITVKDSPSRSLVFVTRLDDAAPVPGATVTVRDKENKVRWTGPTDASGVAEIAELGAIRGDNWWALGYVVTAEKDGDLAYVGSDWTDGIDPWAFDLNFDLSEAKPQLRGSVFTDRGVYKRGEEIHLKGILRSDTAAGISLLPAGTVVKVVTTSSQDDDVDTRTLTLSEWGGADWTFTVPADAPLGLWSVGATVEGQALTVRGEFLVAAYRRPDFRVDAELLGADPVAGASLSGVVTGRYLFGAAMANRAVKWTLSKTALSEAPAAVRERWPSERWVLTNEEDAPAFSGETVREDESALDEKGQIALELETDPAAGVPIQYTLEGVVTDVSRQTIAGRSSFRVESAPYVVGYQRPPFFVDGASLDTEVVAVDPAGQAVAGVSVKLALTQVQWHSVRRAEGGGFYTWETEKKEVPAGEWEVASADRPAPLQVPLSSGGFFILKATWTDARGRSATAASSFYAVGAGVTAWERYDHPRIDLVPEKQTWKPGETARLLVKSPWESATALLTVEREGVRSHRVFTLQSTQETVSVPITEADVPNVYVSVLLVKGRSGSFGKEDSSDPGKPAFRLGYARLRVDDGSKRLQVDVKADREEYRPGARARVDVTVTAPGGAPASAEVTLWAVDYGVLSLTGYHAPDVRSAVWVEKALQVMTADSRQNIISRRVIEPKGADDGGGGGVDDGPGTVRRDFRVLAFWLGSVPTDARGHAVATVTLPESLTTYRIMAVAGDAASRFGAGQKEIRTSKPVLLKPAFPRFLTTGDVTRFGAVVHSQLARKGTALVTLKSLDPGVLEVEGEPKQKVDLGPRSAQEVRFRLRAKGPGSARLQMAVKMEGETDAFEERIPVATPLVPEVVAAYGEASPDARETVTVPAGTAPGMGGLRVETASTALVGLGEGARYLVDYPYGCAEQRSSAALALLLAGDLGDAFRLGIETGKVQDAATATLKELEGFQCADGGFAFWKGQCSGESPYVTSWVLHVMQRGKALGHPASAKVVDRALAYLDTALGAPKPINDGWWPAYTAWQAFAVKVLAEGGKTVDSPLTRLFGQLDRMPVFAHAYLLDALAAKGETGPRADELLRRIRNAVRREGGTAHVEELNDPYLLWFWNSNVRSTALVLQTLAARKDAGDLPPLLARWLVEARQRGRWGNTQENATALSALVAYYRAYESEVPEFVATIALDKGEVARATFSGRSTAAQVKDVPLAEVARRAGADGTADLTLHKEGTGVLFYSTRLSYALDTLPDAPREQGIRVERQYAPQVEKGEPAPAATFAAGELVKVTLTVHTPAERRYVAVSDPLPAGFEPVDTLFATTARALVRQQEQEEEMSWSDWWARGGFDHVERHDDKVVLFATRLEAGDHTFSYVVRATTSGTFRTGPTRAEEMYEPEVSGRTAGQLVTVTEGTAPSR